jgi:hypothetical protein
MMIADAAELQRQVAFLARRRQQHGYHHVVEIRAPVIGEWAA